MSETAKAAITNIFVLMLENHSFDQMLGRSGLPGLRVAPGNASNSYDGKSYPLVSPGPWSMTTDPGHEFPDVLQQLCGADAANAYLAHCDKGTKKDPNHGVDCSRCTYPAIDLSGFVSSYATSTSEATGTPGSAHYGDVMGAFDTRTQLPVLYQLAQEFAVCDAWHSSMPGPTWPNRFFVHGGSSAGMDVSPEMNSELPWETLRGFAYENGSIYDALNAAGHRFRLYQDKTNAFSDKPSHWWQGGWISQVASLKGLSLADIVSLGWFEQDIRALKADGSPAYADIPYTFIEPNFGASFFSKQHDGDVTFDGPRYLGGSSQHPEDNCYGGEALIKFVYETVFGGASPIRDTSLLIITYDEHGGFYDSATPPAATPPGDKTPAGQEYLNRYCFDFCTYGVRVPAVIVSPWIAKGKVDHTLYDHTSILATLRTKLGLGHLTQRDAKANDLWDLLSEPAPRTDIPRVLVDPARPPVPGGGGGEAIEAPLADIPLPPSGNKVGFLHTLLQTEIALAEKSGTRSVADIVADFRAIATHGQASAYVAKIKAMLDAS
jgi:phospholipase C